MDEILQELIKIRKLLENSQDVKDYTYNVVKIQDDELEFSASLAQLADNGYEFVSIVHKNIGAYQVLLRKKKDLSGKDTGDNKKT